MVRTMARTETTVVDASHGSRPSSGSGQSVGSEVDQWLAFIDTASPTVWLAMVAGYTSTIRDPEYASKRIWIQTTVEEGGQRGLSSGLISVDAVRLAKEEAQRAAERALPSVEAHLMSKGAPAAEVHSSRLLEGLQRTADLITTLVLIHPFLTEEEATALWAPYWSVSALIPGSPQSL